MARRTRNWARSIENPDEHKPVAWVLPLTLATMSVSPLVGDTRWGQVLGVVLIGAGALFTLERSGVRRSVRRPATVIVVVGILATASTNVAGSGGGTREMQVLALSLFALLLLLTPALMVLRLMLRPTITLDTVAGALSAYLQVGIFFAVLYRLADIIDHGTFFAQGDAPTASFQYFSYITLTTVGYGDLTPAQPFGQFLATLEAVLGQLFLVSVVGMVVGNLGAKIPHRGDAEGAVGPEEPTE